MLIIRVSPKKWEPLQCDRHYHNRSKADQRDPFDRASVRPNLNAAEYLQLQLKDLRL